MHMHINIQPNHTTVIAKSAPVARGHLPVLTRQTSSISLNPQHWNEQLNRAFCRLP
jgi:hypothetical protein